MASNPLAGPQPAAGSAFTPDADRPGWLRWHAVDPPRFNDSVLAPLIARAEGATCRLRITPRQAHTNAGGAVHGGVILSLVDVAMFAALQIITGIDITGAVTLDVAAQFIGAGDPALPLDALAEVLRETRRFAFVRGLVVQGDDDARIVASFSGTVRKRTAPITPPTPGA